MLGCKSFRAARITTGIELMHMIRKGQLQLTTGAMTPAEQFYSLAA